MSKSKSVLRAENSAELLSYIINVTPELRGQIDLPVQRSVNKTYRTNYYK